MRLLRQALRLPLLIGLLVLGLLMQVLVQPWLGQPWRRRLIGWWSRGLLCACGVRLVEVSVPSVATGMSAVERRPDGTRRGETATVGAAVGPAGHDQHPLPDASVASSAAVAGGVPSLATLAPGRMLVANHQSWLDIFAINALAPSAFVAKAEIRRWPLVGWLVAMAGTVFIERGRRHAVADAVQQLRERIRSGYPAAFFPEAVVHVGPSLKPFHGNLLEAAIAEQAEVIPIGIRYQYDHDGSPGRAAWYDGELSFARSVMNVLGAADLAVLVHVLPPVTAAGRSRQALAGALRAQISAALGMAD
ncbi:MAG: lysophospholipid acyltransferase family protein [Lautropia sp.]|nr:lysophospholipid acyltransferase family protein [Lautropia sp.]